MTLPDDADLRPALEQWTELQQLLWHYPDLPFTYQRYINEGDDVERLLRNMSDASFQLLFPGGQELSKKLRPLYDKLHSEAMENLACTIVFVGEDINDRQLMITTHGLDKDDMTLSGYCVGGYRGHRLASMPVLGHGVPPNRPWETEDIKFYRTACEDEMGDTVQCCIDLTLATSKTKPGTANGFTFRYMEASYFYQ